jgi:hypothetical protein
MCAATVIQRRKNMEVAEWIQQLRKGQLLPEKELKRLCKKVRDCF